LETLAVIIPTYNRREKLAILLNFLCNGKLNNIEYKIIVVNDGSTDGTSELIGSKFPEVSVIEGDGTWWYTKCINEGIKYAHKFNPDYFLLMNDDIKLSADFFEKLDLLIIHSINNDTIYGFLILTVEEPIRIVSSGVYGISKLTGRNLRYHEFLENVDPKKLVGSHKSLILPGKGMLIPARIVYDLNQFDESFKQYHSDGDFCLRAIKKGYSVVVTWDIKVYSFVEKTSSSSSYIKKSNKEFLKSFISPVTRNYLPAKIRFIIRHHGIFRAPLIISIFLLSTIKNHLIKKKLIST